MLPLDPALNATILWIAGNLFPGGFVEAYIEEPEDTLLWPLW